MKLYLIRHGIAVDRAEYSRQDDAQRPLTSKGRARLRAQLPAIKKLLFPLDCIITSPAVRARQTADIIAEAFPGSQIEDSSALRPDAVLQPILNLIRQKHTLRAIALVGHEPTLSLIACHFLHLPEGSMSLKKGGVCALVIRGGTAKLAWLATPKILIGKD